MDHDTGTESALRAKGATFMSVMGGNSELRMFMQAHYDYNTGISIVFANAKTAADNLTPNVQVSMTFSNASSMEISSGKSEYPNLAYLGNDLWDLDGDGNADIRIPYAAGGGSFSLRAGTKGGTGGASEYVAKIHFGSGNDSAEDYYYIRDRDCTAEGLGIAGVRMEAQANAQQALVDLNDAIIKKDAARLFRRPAEQAGKYGFQPANPGREPPGGGIPHLRR